MEQREQSQATPSRAQCQTCLNIAEARTNGAARAEPSLLELCRVVTEEDEVKEQGGSQCLLELCRVVTEEDEVKEQGGSQCLH